MFQISNFKKNGFTLTEMLVAITIFILVVVAVYSAYTLSQRGYLSGEEVAEITQNGRVILERMSREIRQAKEIITELSDDGSEISSIIEFEDGHITTRYYYICYYQEGSEVKRKVKRYYFPSDPSTFLSWDTTSPTETLTTITTEGPVIIGEYVTNLEFWGSRIINISLTLEKRNKSIELETKIFGRNL
ncbi:prepilin-type N-terminal cleavage/methylation domain-containing protein [Patescibacteria group bacterium]|nr:prepilin-type N-terminal cleavage/methylation domain-containing protein [Patescibacteria group bacterium]